jgi:hypothetical protein
MHVGHGVAPARFKNVRIGVLASPQELPGALESPDEEGV